MSFLTLSAEFVCDPPFPDSPQLLTAVYWFLPQIVFIGVCVCVCECVCDAHILESQIEACFTRSKT